MRASRDATVLPGISCCPQAGWVLGISRYRSANLEGTSQSRPDSGLWFLAKVLKTFYVVPSSLASDSSRIVGSRRESGQASSKVVRVAKILVSQNFFITLFLKYSIPEVV